MSLQECVDDMVAICQINGGNVNQTDMKGVDNTFEFLVEYITAKVVEWLIRDKNIGLEEALLLFHNSETFNKLCEHKTDMYIESPAYVYEILKKELSRGTIRGLTD